MQRGRTLRKDMARNIVGLLVLLVASCLIVLPYCMEYWPGSHDSLRYACLFSMFKDSFLAGNIYPRWLPDEYGGYGYPTFVFYQPGIFYLMLPFFLVCRDILCSFVATAAVVVFAGGAGAFFLVEKIMGDFKAALFSALLFLLTPYLFVDLYVRGDMSELSAMMFAPWVLLAAVSLNRRFKEGGSGGGPLVLVSISLAAIVYLHPFVAMFMYLLVIAIIPPMMADTPKPARGRYGIACLIAFACGAMLSSPYWLPAFMMRGEVDYSSALKGAYVASDNLVYPSQFFSRFWGYGHSRPGFDSDGLSFQLGLPHFILSVLGFAVCRSRKLIFGVFISYLACIFLMSTLSGFLWKNIPGMGIIQFPWRLLSAAALVQAVCVSGLALHFPDGRKAYVAGGAVLFLSALWYLPMFAVEKYPDKTSDLLDKFIRTKYEGFYVFAAGNEFLPRTALRHPPFPRLSRPMLEVSDPKTRAGEFEDSSQHHPHFALSCAEAQTITLNQFYFPGWAVSVAGKRVEDSTLRRSISPDGRIQVQFPAGENIELEAYYDRVPYSRPANYAALFGLCLLAAVLAIERRKKKILGGR